MRRKNIKFVLAMMISMIISITAFSCIISANDFTKEELAYGNYCYTTWQDVTKLFLLFKELGDQKDIDAESKAESMVVISVKINDLFEYQNQISASPSKRFDK